MYQWHEGQLRVHVIFTTKNVVYGQTQVNLWNLICSKDITHISLKVNKIFQINFCCTVFNNGLVRSLELYKI